MKTKILLISLALAGTAVFTAAQTKGPFGGPRPHLGRAIEHLNLNEEQASQIEALHQKHRAEMQALREAGKRPSREAMRERFENHRAQFEALLTPNQLATLEELKNERGMRGKRGMRSHHFGRHLRQLDLSDEQKEQLKTLREERREEIRQKRQSGERPTREEMAAHRAQMRADLAQILNTDQLATLNELQENRGLRGKRGKRGHHLGRVLHQLDLSDEQKEQLKTLRQEHWAEIKASRESGERPPLEEFEAHRAEAREKIEAILTPEQREKLNGLLPANASGNVSGSAKSNATSLEDQSWGAIKEETKKD